MAAQEQGKFWELHDRMFASQPKIQKEFLLGYARDLGLDVGRFEKALDTQRGKAVVDADMAEARAAGVTGTPAFFVNGKLMSGAKPFEEFARAINAELRQRNIPIPDGAASGGI